MKRSKRLAFRACPEPAVEKKNQEQWHISRDLISAFCSSRLVMNISFPITMQVAAPDVKPSCQQLII